jgi:C1A family cysteine protease
MKKLFWTFLVLSFVSGITSCKKDDGDEEDTTEPSVVTGWNGGDDPSTVPSSINLASGNLPASYDLVPKFPPVGDQGQYGTCVAWASGYNMKSALEGMDRGLTSGQLASVSNQISPRDLFTAIPDGSKGSNCNGTNFTDALDLLLQRGAATLQTVPYNNLNGCNNSLVQGNWTTEAGSHKIKSYRKIDLNAASIKEQIANNVPVLCGAKLSDNFMTWNDGNVMSSNTTYNQTGIHSYHALIIAGYDDNKGPNGAFRIINSWSQQWGDAGYIWVDYNFFVTEFCYGGNVYIAANDNGNNPPPNNDTTITGSVDLAAWAFNDISMGWNTTVGLYERQIEYNIYNIGDQTAASNPTWDIHYLYYNAYDASEYGFLFYDEITNSVPAGNPPVWQFDHYALNFDIAPGDNLGNAAFGSSTIYQGYYVPLITGLYYLVILADSYDAYAETDEQNNIFYTTGQYPVYLVDGEVQKVSSNGVYKPTKALKDYNFKNYLTPDRHTLSNSPFRSAVNSNYPNAYSNEEIRQLIMKEKNSPRWNERLRKFKASREMHAAKK